MIETDLLHSYFVLGHNVDLLICIYTDAYEYSIKDCM